jgi:hypothetical protein
LACSVSFKWNACGVEVSSNAALTAQSHSPRFQAVIFSWLQTQLLGVPSWITKFSLDWVATVVPTSVMTVVVKGFFRCPWVPGPISEWV